MNPARKVLLAGALAGTALIGGAVGASFLGTAGAATNTTNATTASSSSSSSSVNPPAQGPGRPAPDWSRAGHQANGKTEALLTGTAKSKAIAAAEAAVPGATARRAESDAEGATYEVHMTKSDGSVVTVKLDASFQVTKTITGMG